MNSKLETRRTRTSSDPFQVLGIAPDMDLSLDELESRYVALSRESHPDYHSGADPATQAEMVRRSAEVNDAYRALREPWRRAERIVEHLSPGCLDRSKALAPEFLAEVMELAEEVDDVATSSEGSESARTALLRRIEPQVAEYLLRVRDALRAGRVEHAAELIHQARYYRKALRDLDATR